VVSKASERSSVGSAVSDSVKAEDSMLEFGDTQGFVFSGYLQKPLASYLLLKVTSPVRARAFLRDVAQLVTTGNDRPADACVNVAISAAGLAALGLPDDAFQTFPLEFREGMAGSETRSRALGDTGSSDPSHWRWGQPNDRVHVLLMLFARDEAVLERLVNAQRSAFAGALSVAYERRTRALPDRREHFGFTDGIAQPIIEGSRQERSGAPSVKAGEFILGYRNEYGKLPFVPNVAPALDVAGQLVDCQPDQTRRSLGHNGSFVIVRELDQRVYDFWRYLREAAERLSPGSTAADGAVRLAAKCVGRWPSGAPLVNAPDADDRRLAQDDDFGYFWRDRDGQRCPIGAHIRRTNPRDSLEPDPINSKRVVDRHRILRRGRSYGPPIDVPWRVESDDGVERGLFFVCLNANIRRQFEFVQQTWANNPKFGGLYDERDPLIGDNDGATSELTIPGRPARQRLEGLPRFVDVRGGEYFFLPSVRALRFLASLTVSAH
jgi:Dyp-type peroxidase family